MMVISVLMCFWVCLVIWLLVAIQHEYLVVEAHTSHIPTGYTHLAPICHTNQTNLTTPPLPSLPLRASSIKSTTSTQFPISASFMRSFFASSAAPRSGPKPGPHISVRWWMPSLSGKGARATAFMKTSTADQGQVSWPANRAGLARRARADMRPERWGR